MGQKPSPTRSFRSASFSTPRPFYSVPPPSCPTLQSILGITVSINPTPKHVKETHSTHRVHQPFSSQPSRRLSPTLARDTYVIATTTASTMDSCMELHGPGVSGEQQAKWASAPLPVLGSSAGDALAQHLLLMDLEEMDDGTLNGSPLVGSPYLTASSPERRNAMMAAAAAAGSIAPAGGSSPAFNEQQDQRSASGPIAPSGFTPAEVSWIVRRVRGLGWTV